AHKIAEHFFENIGKTAEAAKTLRARTGTASSATACAHIESAMAKAVIGGALLIVFQDVISFANFFELLFGFFVIGVFVGVVLHGKLAVSFFQLVRAGFFLDAQNLIKIFF